MMSRPPARLAAVAWLQAALIMSQRLMIAPVVGGGQSPAEATLTSSAAEAQSLHLNIISNNIVSAASQSDDDRSLTTNSQDKLMQLPEQQQPEQPARYRRRLKSSSLPEFSAPIGNVTAVLGRDTRLICTVEHLGQYQVAWLKEETKTIISIDTNIIITNYRIFLIPDEEERKWVLHIKDVQESDRGFYQCQVNTSPMRSTSGYLEVVVPPTIIESQTSQVAEVAEHSNVSIQCRANGHPRPGISWRREDGEPIKLNGNHPSANSSLVDNSDDSQPFPSFRSSIVPVAAAASHAAAAASESAQHQPIVSHLNDIKSDRLSFYNVDRSMGGVYVCSASNGIPTQAVKRIPVHVKFAPKTSVPSRYISVSLGDQLEVDCLIEAYPRVNSYWSKTSAPPHLSPQADKLETAARWSSPSQSDEASGAPSYERKQMRILHEVESAAMTTNHHPLAANSDDRFLSMQRQQKFSSPMEHQNSPYDDEHPHNRIQLRQVVDHHHHYVAGGDSPLPPTVGHDFRPQRTVITTSSSTNNAAGSAAVGYGSSSAKAYVTVKQATINPYTVKLKMTIAKMQADDYGQYYCIAVNSLGTAESLVIVTKADRLERNRSPNANPADDDSSSSESNEGTNSKSHQQHPSLRQSPTTTNRVIYDTNYLQAIKIRQNNLVSSSKMQQKLRLRQYSDRNGCFTLGPTEALSLITAFMIIHCLL